MPDTLLVKFQKLPDAVKARASDVDAMRTLESLEQQFSVDLAEVVMRVLVQDVEPAKLDEVLASQYHVKPDEAKTVAKHLLDDLFFKYRLLDVPDVKESALPNIPKPLQPQPGASPYLVHPDDSKDLTPHVQALQHAPAPVIDTDPTHVAARLVQMEKVQLDDQLAKRFQRIVVARLVDVRDKTETRDMLMRSAKIGGMSFDEPRAERIVRELERIVEELHRRPKPVVPKPAPPPAPAPKPVAAMPQPRPAIPAAAPKPTMPAPAPVLAPKPPVKGVVAPPPWLRPARVPAAPPPVKPATPPPAPRPRPTSPPTPSYRDVVTDVRAPARVMGPLEVLGSLSIEDFRRLGGTPQACAMKIGEEFETLGQDSFAQRAAGIQAFRKSPTFAAYLALGQLAMERKEEVKEVVELLRAQGKPSLTEAEFDAISSVMRQNRF